MIHSCLDIWNFSSCVQLDDIELNTRREIPDIRASMYHSLYLQWRSWWYSCSVLHRHCRIQRLWDNREIVATPLNVDFQMTFSFGLPSSLLKLRVVLQMNNATKTANRYDLLIFRLYQIMSSKRFHLFEEKMAYSSFFPARVEILANHILDYDRGFPLGLYSNRLLIAVFERRGQYPENCSVMNHGSTTAE